MDLASKRISRVNNMNPLLKKAIVQWNKLVGSMIFFLKRFKDPPADAKKILFISLYFNGDVLFGTPLINLLRKIYPEAEIHFWAKTRIRSLLEGYPFIKKIHYFDDIRTRRFEENAKLNLKGKWGFFKQLRKEKYDIIVDLTGLSWTALAVQLAKPKYSFGFNFHGLGFLYNFESPAIGTGHLIDTQLNLVLKNRKFESKLRSFTEIDRTPAFYVSDNSKRKIDELLASLGFNGNRKFIIIHTTAGWEAKKWQLENYVELIKRIKDKFPVMLIGGNEDNENAKSILEKCEGVYDFTGQLTLNQSAELISRASLFIGSDSGPLYIAQAVGIRTLSLFGPTNPLFSAPRGEKHSYVYHELFCSAEKSVQNCKLNGGLNCRTVDCIKMITVDQIVMSMNRLTDAE